MSVWIPLWKSGQCVDPAIRAQVAMRSAAIFAQLKFALGHWQGSCRFSEPLALALGLSAFTGPAKARR